MEMTKSPLYNKHDEMDMWYRRGYEAGKRDNPSGCCCKITEGDKIESYCGLHAADRDKILAGIKLVIAYDLGIPWSEVRNEDIQSYINEAERLGVV